MPQLFVLNILVKASICIAYSVFMMPFVFKILFYFYLAILIYNQFYRVLFGVMCKIYWNWSDVGPPPQSDSLTIYRKAQDPAGQSLDSATSSGTDELAVVIIFTDVCCIQVESSSALQSAWWSMCVYWLHLKTSKMLRMMQQAKHNRIIYM
jgi:hypothetical protein